MIGTFDSQLAFEFFQGFVNHAFVTLHIDNLRGENAHHQCRDRVQGLRPGAARRAGAGSALGGHDSVHEGFVVA
jgi:imidazoleglycerol phosphate dehydratase HisB